MNAEADDIAIVYCDNMQCEGHTYHEPAFAPVDYVIDLLNRATARAQPSQRERDADALLSSVRAGLDTYAVVYRADALADD